MSKGFENQKIFPAKTAKRRGFNTIMFKFALFAVFVAICSAFLPAQVRVSRVQSLAMQSADIKKVLAASFMGASLFFGAASSRAEIDYDGIKYLGGGDKIDINNANIRAYLKVPGAYPSLASKIVKNGPFKSVADVYSIPELSSKEKELLKASEGRFVALDVKPEYDIDKINNGLYR